MVQPKNDVLTKVSMLDVGQGDSFLIQAANGTQLLIDGGKNDAVLRELSKVMPNGDRFIDVVIATHPDADHIGGLPLVFSRYRVGLFLTTQAESESEIFEHLHKTIIDKNIPAYYVRSGMNISLDTTLPTYFSVLFPDRDTTGWETNTASIVGRLQAGQRSVLFTGDAPASIENNLAKTNTDSVVVDILKVSHHGSGTSSDEQFLRIVSPELALISAGKNNRYGHPSPEVMNRMKQLGIRTVSTQENGTYTLKTDGAHWFTK